MKKFFTSESVTQGHPDKMCDYISDSILDAYLEKDKYARVACETVAGKGEVLVTGEITSTANIDIEEIVRKTIKEIGYDNEKTDIDYRNCKVRLSISKQSPDIALGVNNKNEGKYISEGAGDQGMMFGYACNETKNYMPLSIELAHYLAKRLEDVRKKGILKYLKPDGKVQVTTEYEDNKPKRIDTVVISTQHEANTDMEQLRKDIKEKVIDEVIKKELLDNNTKYFINPTGRFVIGGPLGDTGLTGRKIIVDTYGGYARHGGGAFSGKDATKVDRSGAYMARFVAKNIVANGLAEKCEVKLAYVIGIAEPIEISIDTFGTSKISEEEILTRVKEKFDFSVTGIINYLELRRPIFRKTSNYGHFGKADFTWEKIVKI